MNRKFMSSGISGNTVVRDSIAKNVQYILPFLITN
ncbi:Unknown protein sequence [Pseudomonas amygdali pv. ulmi]|uniref:Uncharacterized protein n=1 Tax=Pseudomonas amygdali pv. ulmi TaxID=251720 RepID=A0A0Q0D733_PSEA0|nr:Unknown protein sequence [Pseudomonas amygdali pv. ulmi]